MLFARKTDRVVELERSAYPEDESVVTVTERSALFVVGVIIAIAALICATVTLVILLGLTSVAPTPDVIETMAVINTPFVVALLALVGHEVWRLLKARRRGRAAARLHIRIVGFFSIVAITPAVVVAVLAGFSLNVGLDHWFATRTQEIISSSTNIARAYIKENASYLMGQTIQMASDLERNRALFSLDRTGFEELMTRQARGRGLLGAFLVESNGSTIAQADVKTDKPLPAIPKDALERAAAGQPNLSQPGDSNLVAAIIKLNGIPGSFLYTVRPVDPNVLSTMALMEQNSDQYRSMEAGRLPLRIALALVYLGFTLVVLLAAIWAAIALADRIVRPIRVLITAADQVASGNMNVLVPVHSVDGDVGRLSRTFNKMISEIRTQRDVILEAKDEVDVRRRFIEAVLSGVSASVIGVDTDRRITIANSSTEALLGMYHDAMLGKQLSEIAPEIDHVLSEAVSRHRGEFRKEIALMRNGTVKTLSVQVTRENTRDARESYVVTLDDITDLVIAQRSTAWGDVARRIAHEIKNPLTPIQLSAERIQRRYGKQIDPSDRSVFDQCTETIIRQVGDIGRMVDEFSAFARMPKPTKEKSDLRQILRDAMFLREMGNSHVNFIQELGDKPLEGSFDARMLGQAFGNLIKNAVEAIEAVPSEEREERKVKIHAVFDEARDRFTVDVIDNGRGLPVENRHSILEPYMTMREKGTGLGLAIVKKIIEEHGGQLELHDAPADFDRGNGAMIRVHLPRLEMLPAAPAYNDRESVHGL
ncbi:sensor histidine kinase NtrY-like [Oryzifoliimicrobium ureilyticus]|uniref:sensor histidine kinase NtrY-like n=1 Tax=Oryzifoliimicrobium ureilyticus TaxID=3113724 RepID=UPI003076446D